MMRLGELRQQRQSPVSYLLIAQSLYLTLLMYVARGDMLCATIFMKGQVP